MGWPAERLLGLFLRVVGSVEAVAVVPTVLLALLARLGRRGLDSG